MLSMIGPRPAAGLSKLSWKTSSRSVSAKELEVDRPPACGRTQPSRQRKLQTCWATLRRLNTSTEQRLRHHLGALSAKAAGWTCRCSRVATPHQHQRTRHQATRPAPESSSDEAAWPGAAAAASRRRNGWDRRGFATAVRSLSLAGQRPVAAAAIAQGPACRSAWFQPPQSLDSGLRYLARTCGSTSFGQNVEGGNGGQGKIEEREWWRLSEPEGATSAFFSGSHLFVVGVATR